MPWSTVELDGDDDPQAAAPTSTAPTTARAADRRPNGTSRPTRPVSRLRGFHLFVAPMYVAPCRPHPVGMHLAGRLGWPNPIEPSGHRQPGYAPVGPGSDRPRVQNRVRTLLHAVSTRAAAAGGRAQWDTCRSNLPSTTRRRADAIVGSLLARHLVACGQRTGPVTSRYWWNGSLEQAEEWLVLLKTRRD